MLAEALAAIRRGGVVLHATEGVWGLACDPQQAAAVDKVFELKQRPANKGLVLIADSPERFARQLEGVAHRQEVLESWPGHHTWVLPNHGQYADYVTGGRDTVACRVPGHEQARALCAGVGAPLVSTSANISGEPAIVDEAEAQRLFAGLVDVVLPGKVGSAGRASIIHGADGAILR